MSNTSAPVYVREAEVFWGEVAPHEHIVHLYHDEKAALDILEGYLADGLRRDEAVVVIAGSPTRSGLERRLGALGFDLPALRQDNRYFDFDAEESLANFMFGGWPDGRLFKKFIKKVIDRAGHGRTVRVFGEMVAVLWNQGHNGATVRLEQLWNELRRALPFPLFCSYPKASFTQGATASLELICAAHTKIISADAKFFYA